MVLNPARAPAGWMRGFLATQETLLIDEEGFFVYVAMPSQTIVEQLTP